MAIPVGSKAEGEAFFDRVTEREDIWEFLEGNHLQLSGPRRLGKTSLLQKLTEEAKDKNLWAELKCKPTQILHGLTQQDVYRKDCQTPQF